MKYVFPGNNRAKEDECGCIYGHFNISQTLQMVEETVKRTD